MNKGHVREAKNLSPDCVSFVAGASDRVIALIFIFEDARPQIDLPAHHLRFEEIEEFLGSQSAFGKPR